LLKYQTLTAVWISGKQGLYDISAKGQLFCLRGRASTIPTQYRLMNSLKMNANNGDFIYYIMITEYKRWNDAFNEVLDKAIIKVPLKTQHFPNAF
jgi:hypothetical protein